jgi:hypothetical protein
MPEGIMKRFVFACTLFLLLTPNALRSQAPLPVVEGVEWASFRDRTRTLLKGLESLKSPLPVETVQRLNLLLDKEDATPETAEAVQKLLDPFCMVGVSINPESRVKAARGPAGAELPLNRETIVLIKINNEAGVTQALNLAGTQLTTADKPEDGKWLRAVIANDDPFPSKLSGKRVDYVVLKLTPFEAGKREATLKFDVGQGTQDLGFRGEVPILFRVK